MPDDSVNSGPLSDLVVLDLTRYLSGPYCTLLLAGMGARVIKVDHPVSGDPTISGPPFAGSDGPTIARAGQEYGIAYLKRQRGKESTTIDLKHPEGCALFKQLVVHADVVVENFRPGVAQRLGIDYPTLSEVNPRLVYCAISGYGQTGPDSAMKSYDMMAQAAAGLMGITGEPDGPPMKAASPLADTTAGTWGALSILAALQERNRSGKGQSIDVSMVDCLFSMMMDEPLDCYEQLGLEPRIGNRTMRFSPFNAYQASDGWVAIGVVAAADWTQIAAVIGKPALATDDNFSRIEWRIQHNDEVDALIGQWVATQTTADALASLQAADIACSPVRTPREAIDSPHLQARGMIQPLTNPDGSATGVIGPDMPFRMSRSTVSHQRPAPLPGGHTDTVLNDMLSLDAATIADLKTRRII